MCTHTYVEYKSIIFPLSRWFEWQISIAQLRRIAVDSHEKKNRYVKKVIPYGFQNIIQLKLIETVLYLFCRVRFNLSNRYRLSVRKNISAAYIYLPFSTLSLSVDSSAIYSYWFPMEKSHAKMNEKKIQKKNCICSWWSLKSVNGVKQFTNVTIAPSANIIVQKMYWAAGDTDSAKRTASFIFIF